MPLFDARGNRPIDSAPRPASRPRPVPRFCDPVDIPGRRTTCCDCVLAGGADMLGVRCTATGLPPVEDRPTAGACRDGMPGETDRTGPRAAGATREPLPLLRAGAETALRDGIRVVAGRTLARGPPDDRLRTAAGRDA
jgi:hypothetical protein